MLPATILLKNGECVIVRRAQTGDEDAYASVANACYLETRFLSRGAEDEMLSAESLLGFIEDVGSSDKEVLLVAVY